MLAIDERGVALRATWRLEHGFINLSLWWNDRCVETFHLTPNEAAALISFLVKGLAEVASTPAAADVITLAGRQGRPATAPKAFAQVRTCVADALRGAAERVAGD